MNKKFNKLVILIRIKEIKIIQYKERSSLLIVVVD